MLPSSVVLYLRLLLMGGIGKAGDIHTPHIYGQSIERFENFIVSTSAILLNIVKVSDMFASALGIKISETPM